MRPESLTFVRLIRTAESLLILILRWRPDWILKGIIKGSFLQEVPHITLPPLNHIYSAISSSSTCSNFCSWKKQNRSLAQSSLFSVVAFSSRPHRNIWRWSINRSSPHCCISYDISLWHAKQTPRLALVNPLNTESLVNDYLLENRSNGSIVFLIRCSRSVHQT